MSHKTEERPCQTEEEAEEWLKESKKAQEHIHEDHENIKAAIELGVTTSKEVIQHKEY